MIVQIWYRLATNRIETLWDSQKADLRRFSSPRTKLLAARCECMHVIKVNCLALWLDESVHASLAASCEELRARTGNPPLCFCLYILMVIDFAVTVENIQNGRRSGGWMPLVSALVRNMASEFWWPSWRDVAEVTIRLSWLSIRSIFCDAG
jgi:hypothetical protein